MAEGVWNGKLTTVRRWIGRLNHVHTATSVRIAAWSLGGSGPPQSYRIVVTAPAIDSVTKSWSKRNPDPDVERQLKTRFFLGIGSDKRATPWLTCGLHDLRRDGLSHPMFCTSTCRFVDIQGAARSDLRRLQRSF